MPCKILRTLIFAHYFDRVIHLSLYKCKLIIFPVHLQIALTDPPLLTEM